MPNRSRVLVVDDEPAIVSSLRFALEDDFDVVTAAGPGEALAQAARQRLDVCLIDLRLGTEDGLDLLTRLAVEHPHATMVVMTAYGSIRSAVECMKRGAHDYITKPLDVEELKAVLVQAAHNSRLRSAAVRLDTVLESMYGPGSMVGDSAPMRQLADTIDKAKQADSNVLIIGESGTGKELVARALHFTGNRRHGPFEAVNCSAIPDTLLESELFGYEKGAFTGALARRIGRFEAADGGTVFLDEIGDMDLAMQAKILRVIQDKSVTRLGGTSPRRMDVRIVAATNRDIETEAAEGRFRQDLFYRLNVITIRVPALREHREDIPLLVRHFVRKFAARSDRDIRGVSAEAVAALCACDYPGNVRQLENAIERAIVLKAPGSGSTLQVEDFGGLLGATASPASRTGGGSAEPIDAIPFRWGDTLYDLERKAILLTLERAGGRRNVTARALGISERNLRNKLNSYCGRRGESDEDDT